MKVLNKLKQLRDKYPKTAMTIIMVLCPVWVLVGIIIMAVGIPICIIQNMAVQVFGLPLEEWDFFGGGSSCNE